MKPLNGLIAQPPQSRSIFTNPVGVGGRLFDAAEEDFAILPEKGRPTFHVGDLARRRLPVEGGQPKTLMAFAILDHRHYFPSIRGKAVGQSGLSVGCQAW